MDLHFSKENYNFSAEVLQKVMIDELNKEMSYPTVYKIATGAKGFGKTFLMVLWALFLVCNFEDYNAMLSRYKYNAAKDNFDKAMKKVINVLAMYGVTLDKAIQDKEIKWLCNDNRFEVTFPNGRMIKIIGIDTPSQWEGKTAAIGEFAMWGLDEVIPLDYSDLDSLDYMYNFSNLTTQILRGNQITLSKEPLEQLRYEDLQVYKTQIIMFGFNIHDKDHPFYQLFVESLFPMNDELRELLEQKKIIAKHDLNFINGLGASIIRGTTLANKANLNQNVYDYGEWLKESAPETYDALYQGAERELNLDKYSYRRDLRENFKVYDINDFYWEGKNYWFDDVVVGIDYADSVNGKDDTAMVALGIELEKHGIWKGYVKEIYLLDEVVISSSQFVDMDKKLSYLALKLNEWGVKFYGLKSYPKIRAGHDSRTQIHVIRTKLMQDFDWPDSIYMRNSFDTILVTGRDRWGIPDRHNTIKYILAEGRFYFNPELSVKRVIKDKEYIVKPYGHLHNDLDNCKNDERTLIRDERVGKNKLDTINAKECALSHYRHKLIRVQPKKFISSV